ncbi:MAG: hypothetical protein RIQ47_1859 [Bacteroidota bacterium]|jgi:hypothetical protein
MKRLRLLPIILATVVFFSACSKDDDNNNTTVPPTKFELLTSHGWRLTAFYEDGVDMTNQYFSACELDNIFNYNTDYSYSIDEGPTKCSPGDPQIIETGVWAFANNQTMLVYEPGTPGEAETTIIQLDATNFKYEDTDFDSTTMTSTTYRVHFVKS